MAVVFSGTKLPQSELSEIQKEIYAGLGYVPRWRRNN